MVSFVPAAVVSCRTGIAQANARPRDGPAPSSRRLEASRRLDGPSVAARGWVRTLMPAGSNAPVTVPS